MEEILRGLIAKIAETSTNFARTANLRDELKVDSVRVFELVFEIEQAFQVRFPEEHYATIQTFEDLVQVVRSLDGFHEPVQVAEAAAG
jgi:acyl carrier protein